MELDGEEYAEALALMFDGLPDDDKVRWWTQGFSFDDKHSFGLRQQAGGPCGVLAVIQGLVLAELIFGEPNTVGPPLAPSSKPVPEADEAARTSALCSALSSVIWQAAQAGRPGPTSARLVVLSGPPESVSPGLPVDSLLVVEADSEDDLQGMVASSLPSFSSPAGVMLLVLSCLLSRGLPAVRADMDEPSSLVTTFGQTTTELLNLVLTGEANSGVFDGEQCLGEGADSLRLRGVRAQPRIGYLSHAEALRYAEVGSFLKTPSYPVWIIASESHFTVLWSGEPSALTETPSSTARAAFAKLDTISAGFISSSDLDALLAGLGVKDTAPPGFAAQVEDGGIILWSTLWPKLAPLLGLHAGASDAARPAVLPLPSAPSLPSGSSGWGSNATTPPSSTRTPPPTRPSSPAYDAVMTTSGATEAADPDTVRAIVQSMCASHPFAVADGQCIHAEAVTAVLEDAAGILGVPASTLRAPGQSAASYLSSLPRASVGGKYGNLPDAGDYVPVVDLGLAVAAAVKQHAAAPVVVAGHKRPRDDDVSSVQTERGKAKGGMDLFGDTQGVGAGEGGGAALTHPSEYDAFACTRSFDVYHYNGLTDGGRHPVLCHMTLKQSDGGGLGGGGRDAADAMLLSQQWAVGGGIEEQTAAAIALSNLPSTAAFAPSSSHPSPALGAARRDVSTLEGILRTRWAGVVVQTLHGEGPRLH